jgi:hypothetical protein
MPSPIQDSGVLTNQRDVRNRTRNRQLAYQRHELYTVDSLMQRYGDVSARRPVVDYSKRQYPISIRRRKALIENL